MRQENAYRDRLRQNPRRSIANGVGRRSTFQMGSSGLNQSFNRRSSGVGKPVKKHMNIRRMIAYNLRMANAQMECIGNADEVMEKRLGMCI